SSRPFAAAPFGAPFAVPSFAAAGALVATAGPELPIPPTLPASELSPTPPATPAPRPDCVDVCVSMASRSNWRSAPAPAGAPRWAELPDIWLWLLREGPTPSPWRPVRPPLPDPVAPLRPP